MSTAVSERASLIGNNEASPFSFSRSSELWLALFANLIILVDVWMVGFGVVAFLEYYSAISPKYYIWMIANITALGLIAFASAGQVGIVRGYKNQASPPPEMKRYIAWGKIQSLLMAIIAIPTLTLFIWTRNNTSQVDTVYESGSPTYAQNKFTGFLTLQAAYAPVFLAFLVYNIAANSRRS